MTLLEASILIGTGLIAGAMNSVAGGGSFIVFPTLMFLGLSPIQANATSTLAMWPGTFATMAALRQEIVAQKHKLPFYVGVSLAGGAFGAFLVTQISNASFATLVPYLLLMATLIFTFRSLLLKGIVKIHSRFEGGQHPYFTKLTSILFVAICIYGGFFGAGMGILMLALFSLMGMTHIHEMNALRSTSGLCANTIALFIFFGFNFIVWPQGLLMGAGAIVGGYGGAHYARRFPQSWSRGAVVVIGWTMTVYFFYKLWFL